jgi:predicted O-linked N-acetylglucosamine transferase (SPINDLY family)
MASGLRDAMTLLRGGRPAEAEALCRALVAQHPGSAEAHHWHGVALRELGRTDGALAAFRAAVAIDPGQPGTQYRLASTLMDRAILDEAIATYRVSLRLLSGKPGQEALLARIHSDLGFALMVHGEHEAAIDEFRHAIGLRPDARGHSQLVYYLQYLPGADAAAQLREAREWDRLYAAPLGVDAPPHTNDPDPGRLLRVGYVSGDLRDHALASFLPPVFERHDRARFEVIAYSNVDRPDDVTARYRARADRWRDVSGMQDEAVARLVREDGVDVLVDLSMHSGGGRPLVFARKPAPVQVCWLAYPGTTGMGAMDYRLTDPYLDPPELDGEASGRAYAERSLRLTRSFWCYRPRLSPPVAPLPARASGHVTLGTCNKFSKVNDGTLRLWARVLEAVPGSRCFMVVPSFAAQARVRERFGQLGIHPDRVEMVGQRRYADYLANFSRIDVGLDTVPYGGGTTSIDALYMGVPVVTLRGETVVGRAGTCLASNLGMPGLVASTADEYVQIAVRLASDLDALEATRRGLRARLEASPLMDEEGFVRDLERAYREAWSRWCLLAR